MQAKPPIQRPIRRRTPQSSLELLSPRSEHQNPPDVERQDSAIHIPVARAVSETSVERGEDRTTIPMAEWEAIRISNDGYIVFVLREDAETIVEN